MSDTNITFGTPVKIVTTINDLLTRNGKTFADITDVKYMLKENKSDTDEASVFNKSVKIGGSITLVPANSSFEVNIIPSDYGDTKIKAGEQYLVCIGVEFNDSTYYIEDYDPHFTRMMNILYDKIRA